MNNKNLDPERTTLVIKHNGTEVGRVPATSISAPKRIEQLGRKYGVVTVDMEEDPDAGLIASVLGSRRL